MVTPLPLPASPPGCSPDLLLLKLPPGDPLRQFSLGLRFLHAPAHPQGPTLALKTVPLMHKVCPLLPSGFQALPRPVCVLGKGLDQAGRDLREVTCRWGTTVKEVKREYGQPLQMMGGRVGVLWAGCRERPPKRPWLWGRELLAPKQEGSGSPRQTTAKVRRGRGGGMRVGGQAGEAPGSGLDSGQSGSNPRMLESLVESGLHFQKAWAAGGCRAGRRGRRERERASSHPCRPSRGGRPTTPVPLPQGEAVEAPT